MVMYHKKDTLNPVPRSMDRK